MTWGEFKREVEAQGLRDDEEISWIDVSEYYLPVVSRYESGAVKIADGRSRHQEDWDSPEDPPEIVET